MPRAEVRDGRSREVSRNTFTRCVPDCGQTVVVAEERVIRESITFPDVHLFQVQS